MQIYAINGSPRKDCNTAVLLQKALDGAMSVATEAESEIIHLYDYAYSGCRSCFECKLLGGKNYGRCAVEDDIQGILEKIKDADVVIFGSPIYLANITGQLKSFLERLVFPYFVYDENYSSLAPKKFQTGFIYTMNVTEEIMDELQYRTILEKNEYFVEKAFTKPKTLYVNDTYQFKDYSKYEVKCFDEKKKAKVRETQFPIDCRKAFEMGKAMAEISVTKQN